MFLFDNIPKVVFSNSFSHLLLTMTVKEIHIFFGVGGNYPNMSWKFFAFSGGAYVVMKT